MEHYKKEAIEEVIEDLKYIQQEYSCSEETAFKILQEVHQRRIRFNAGEIIGCLIDINDGLTCVYEAIGRI